MSGDGNGGPVAAIVALGRAFAEATEAVAAVVRSCEQADGNGLDSVAIDMVIALDDALSGIEGLADLVPALAAAGLAGPTITDELRARAEALLDLADAATAARLEHGALGDVEAELQASASEHESLASRVEELERLRRLHDALPELRAQHDGLSRRLEAMVAPVEEAEQALIETAGKVIALSSQRIADLAAATREVLAEVERSEKEWASMKKRHAAEESRLATATADIEKLRTEREDRVAALAVHAGIDQDLLERLQVGSGDPPTTHVRSMLAEVTSLLDRVDDALGRALDSYDHQMAERRRSMPWADPPGD